MEVCDRLSSSTRRSLLHLGTAETATPVLPIDRSSILVEDFNENRRPVELLLQIGKSKLLAKGIEAINAVK